jgi:ACS family glucarate transporter-like MFS transporter
MNRPLDRPADCTAPSRVRHGVLAALCVATTIAYVDRGCISVAVEPIKRDLGLSDEEMGWALSAFFIAYTIFQLPAGEIGHRWGSRRALPVFAMFWSAATGWTALVTGLPGLLLSRLGLGMAEAGIFPCATSTIARWFPSTQRALMSGLLGSFMGVGAAVGAALTGLLLATVPWRGIFILYMVPGIAWAVWFHVWFRDRPEDHPAVNAAERDLIGASVPADPTEREAPGGPTPWAAILTNPAVVWLCAQQFFKAASYVFFLSWFPTYLEKTRDVSVAEVGALTSLPHVALTVGPILGGWLSDRLLLRTGSRRLARQWQAAASLIACGGLVLLAYPIRDPWSAVTVISVGAFCAGLSGPCAYAMTIDVGGRHVAPVFSTMNMAGNAGAVLFPIAVPWLVSATGSWDGVLVLFAGLSVAAGLCWLPFNPDRRIIAKDAP